MSFKSGETASFIDDKLTRFMPLLPLLGLLLGFFLPDIFIHLRPWTQWFIALMTFSGALRMQAAEFGTVVRNPFPLLLFFVLSRILLPVYVLFTSSFFLGLGGASNPDTITGFVLLFSTPTAVSAFIWIVTFRGDKALGLSLVLLDTLMSPLVLPATLSILRGGNVTIRSGSIMASMFLMVVLPTIIGIILNETSRGKIPARISPFFNPLSKIAMLLIIAANASSTLQNINFRDWQIWRITGLSFFFCVSSLLLARLTAFFFKFDYEKSVALTFPSGQRNTSITITLAASYFPKAIALPALINILFQQFLSGIVGKLLFRKGAIHLQKKEVL